MLNRQAMVDQLYTEHLATIESECQRLLDTLPRGVLKLDALLYEAWAAIDNDLEYVIDPTVNGEPGIIVIQLVRRYCTARLRYIVSAETIVNRIIEEV